MGHQPSSVGLPSQPHPPRAHSDLSRLSMLLVPRSTLRRTSPVRRPRCQRRDSPCRWAKSRTCTCRLVNCCTHTHRKVRRLLMKPVEPAGQHGKVNWDQPNRACRTSKNPAGKVEFGMKTTHSP